MSKFVTLAAFTPAGGYSGALAKVQRSLLWYALQALGLTSVNRTTVTATAALTMDQCGVLLVDATAGNVVLTLPASGASADEALYEIHRIDSTSNTVTFAGAGADTIDGAASVAALGILRLKLPAGATVWRSGYLSGATPAAARRAIGVIPVTDRQTVVSGSVDAAGKANYLSIGAGLSVNLAATTTPVCLNFAAGFDASGSVDYSERITADVAAAFSALTASSTLFLYRDRDVASGALSYGFVATLAPVYNAVAPSAPAAGQHWFDFGTRQMKRWSGAAWVVVHRVFMGECVTSGAAVTSVITYAYRGEYDSGLFSVSANSPYSKNSDVGTPCDVNLFFCTSATGLDGGTNEEVPYGGPGDGPNSNYRGCLFGQSTRNVVRMRTQDIFQVMDGSGASSNPASGYLRIRAKRRGF